MELENVTVEIRPRNPWEAMDLGILLIREFRQQIIPAWIIITALTFGLLHLLTGGSLVLSMFLFWWLKPAFDRILLRIFSRALFGTQTTTMESLRSIPEIFSTGLWINLTLLRFNPSRSFHLPVWMLEGLRGESRVKRIRLLAANIRFYPMWLTGSCQLMELVLQIAPLLLLAALIPEGIGSDLISTVMFGEELPGWIAFFTSFFFYLSVVIIEPIYVASGFMLYIDRRTKLEGWDIELAFRRMAKRLESAQKPTPLASSLIAVLITSALLTGNISDLQAAPTVEESRQVINDVLNAEDLNRSKKYTKWVPNWEDEEDFDETNFLAQIKQLIDYIAQLFRGAIWVAVALMIILLIIYHKKWLDILGKIRRRPKKKQPIEQLFGLDLTPESFPDDIPNSAKNLVNSGNLRAALSLLYRASLSNLLDQDELNLRSSDTEGDVLALAKTHISRTRSQYLETLTTSWKNTAYGHHQPDQKTAILLCQQWRQHFGTVN